MDDVYSANRNMAKEIDQLRAENEKLAKCCTQRGARMQKMYEWIADWDLHKFCVSLNGVVAMNNDMPESVDWFDDDGVPK